LELADRLLDQIHALVEATLMDDGVARVARHVEDTQARPQGLRSPPKLTTIEAWHDHVGQIAVTATSITAAPAAPTKLAYKAHLSAASIVDRSG
jgi:negative regulator of sigma E activity